VAGSGPIAAVPADGPSPGSRASDREERERLWAAVERLPEPARTVFRLRCFEQLPFAEVALKVGIKEGNARVLFLRTTERLRAELGEHS
jgi:RNA polymerase sigma factor (sigma-70 family)